MVQVSRLLMPECKIEIDLWGVLPGTMKQVISDPKLPAPGEHYRHAMLVGRTLYAALQLTLDQKTGLVPDATQVLPFSNDRS